MHGILGLSGIDYNSENMQDDTGANYFKTRFAENNGLNCDPSKLKSTVIEARGLAVKMRSQLSNWNDHIKHLITA
jgi:hypothetical protein